MKTLFKYIYIITLICVLCSCERDELNVSGNGSERTIEIVTRIPGFNNVDVKAAADADRPFETAIYTAYLFIFDENGDIVGNYYDLSNGSLYKSLTLKGLNTITACIVANVQESVISNVTKLDDFNSIVLELDYADYSESGYLGVPKLGNNLCFPMFGSVTQDISSSSRIQIPLARLFAKVSVNLAMTLTESTQVLSHFTIQSYNLVNLPTKVRLINDQLESVWATTESAFAPDMPVPAINEDIYDTQTSNEVEQLLGIEVKRAYTFDIYVPEYSVLPTNTTGDEKNKPNNFSEDKYPVYLQITGVFNPITGVKANINYDIYLGEDNSTSFTLNRNIQYNNYLTIKGITNHNGDGAAEIDHRVSIVPIDFVMDFGEVANCYVISSQGEYNLPAYKGAFKIDELRNAPKCTEATHVKILAKTNSNIEFWNYGTSSSPEYFTMEKDANGAIVIGFKITKISDDSNVIIALYNEENIEWSWHLWFVEDPLEGYLSSGNFFNVKTQTMPDGETEMMDRNLGAECSTLGSLAPGTATGLYYQYGNKEPYIEGEFYNGGGDYNNNSWNTEWKSPTDPCPPGYRVPDSNVWTITDNAADVSLGYITAFIYNSNPLMYFPYSGYLNNGEVIYSSSEVKTSTYNDYIYGTLMRAYNIKYSINIQRKGGVYLSSDNNNFIYEASPNGIMPDVTITECKYQTGTKLGKLEIWGREQSYTAGGSISSAIGNFLMTTVRNELQEKAGLDALLAPKMIVKDINKQYGYQIRCVKVKESN